nr:MAG TPA: hypothetical protein [Caudoviricetes sp.]DAT49108.1 MAG TPA: hypothetical protein [Caudoviricetes sp.]
MKKSVAVLLLSSRTRKLRNAKSGQLQAYPSPS